MECSWSEPATGGPPSDEDDFFQSTREDFARRVCDNGERPPINKAWHPVLRAVLEATFRQDFRERPEFEEILDDMQAVVAEVSHDPASGVRSGRSRRGTREAALMGA